MAKLVGDTVELHRIVMFGEDQWLPCIVVRTFRGGFTVKRINGRPFDDQGHEFMDLPDNGNSQHPKMWR